MSKSAFALALLLPLLAFADGEGLDVQKPFGYCTLTSRTDGSKTIEVTGGGCWTWPLPEGTDAAVLVSNGSDMRDAISTAIKRHRVVVLDGSNGPFLISSTMVFPALEDKTILGINGATLQSQWKVSDEDKKMLDEAGVPSMNASSDPLGGTLPNGIAVREEAEYNTRLLMLQKYGNEDYRRSGMFTLQFCRNLILRNIRFEGPGSIDVSGDDPVALYHCMNVWVDHCEFVDGIDGNLDITQASDFNTVSWCRFSYTPRSYMHRLTNLIGGSEEEPEKTHNTTLAFNNWSTLCQGRMPMARVGIIHVLNNYYDCVGSGYCVNPNYHSSLLIEGNYFDSGVKKIFRDNNSEAYVWSPTNRTVEAFTAPQNKGTVAVPYAYSVADAAAARQAIIATGGATLYKGVEAQPTQETEYVPADIVRPTNSYRILGDSFAPFDGQLVICPDITLTFGNDGAWGEPRHSTKTPEGYPCYVSGQGNPFDASGKIYTPERANPPAKGTFYKFTPTKDGQLTVAGMIYMNKALWLLDDGHPVASATVNGMDYTPGLIVNSAETTPFTATFPVSAGHTYHVFCTASKLMFGGFSLDTSSTGIRNIHATAENQKAYTPDGRPATATTQGIIIHKGKKIWQNTKVK